jgi:glucose/arabinose dehydrogenase
MSGRSARSAARRGRRLGALLVALALLGAAASCGGDDPEGSSETPGETVAGSAPTSDPTSTTTTAGSTATTAPPSSEAAPPGPLADVRIRLTELVSLSQPTKLLARPGSELLYVGLKEGRVLAMEAEGDSLTEVDEALDVSDITTDANEQGFLGLAFSPDGEVLYVHHSGPDGETRVASFAMDGDVADPDSRTEILTLDQPYTNHNGGELLVDDDGLLWIGLGDGGDSGDPDDRAQDPDDLLGKVLRIDPTAPSDGRAYGIPGDNPFADGGGRPEIAITGVRNPWRMRFDPVDGSLWIADVGQNMIEEIDHLPAGTILGANLGWSRFEGSDLLIDTREIIGGPPIGPVFEMTHDDGWCSVTGGPVYRGTEIPDLVGGYLFGDFCKPGLAALRLGGDGAVAETVVLDDEVGAVVSIDTDADGEVYVLSLSGQIFRVDPA